jgi:hypothetical protein
MGVMNHYDICVAWNWPYDAEFINLVYAHCMVRNLTVLPVTSNNLNDLLIALRRGQITFGVFFDRASEDDPRFMPFVRWALDSEVFYINRHEHASRSWNKGAMHYALINAGIYTPYTIILPAYDDQPEIEIIDVSRIGEPFIIKPVNGSGGEGVCLDDTSLNQIHDVRKMYPDSSFLVQKYIVPIELGSRPAWFRVLYCTKKIYTCWWNPQTHIYSQVNPAEESDYHLEKLNDITQTIAKVTDLDMFSTEIALTAEELFVAVDYVNDQPDLRPQSGAEDGVPDLIVQDIAERIGRLVEKNTGII